MKRVAVCAVCVVVACTSLLAAGASADAATLVVGQNTGQCPSAAFTSIQAAVNAAAAGDTVLVCPGLYTENVVIGKPLVVRAQPESNRLDCLAPTAPVPDPNSEAVVQSTMIAFQALTDGVTVDGFAIEPALTGVRGGAGVSGLTVSNNLVENANFGVSFGPSGATHSLIQGNCLRGMAVAGVNLRASSSNVSVQGNAFYGHNAGVIVNQSSSGISVRHNASIQDGIFTLVFPATGLDISENTALGSQNASVAAIAVGGTTESTIDGNVIAHGLGNGIGFAGPDQGVPASLSINVQGNSIAHMGHSGIRATPNSLQNSAILSNTSISNGLDGIRIEAGANTNNRIQGNVLLRNSGDDCHDDTVGTATAGTANFWIANLGVTENRAGLCRSAPG